jgi:hypothetical protein
MTSGLAPPHLPLGALSLAATVTVVGPVLLGAVDDPRPQGAAHASILLARRIAANVIAIMIVTAAETEIVLAALTIGKNCRVLTNLLYETNPLYAGIVTVMARMSTTIVIGERTARTATIEKVWKSQNKHSCLIMLTFCSSRQPAACT